MDFPSPSLPAPPVLTPFHPDSIGLVAVSALANAVIGQTASAAWLAANKAFFYPFTLTSPAVAYQLLFWVGATSSGNIDVGIYDVQGNRIVSAGSTAMSATVNTVQELNITDTQLMPGSYLLAVACDNTTGTCYRVNGADEFGLPSYPVYEEAGLTAAALPNPATPVISTEANASIYVCGIQFRSVF